MTNLSNWWDVIIFTWNIFCKLQKSRNLHTFSTLSFKISSIKASWGQEFIHFPDSSNSRCSLSSSKISSSSSNHLFFIILHTFFEYFSIKYWATLRVMTNYISHIWRRFTVITPWMPKICIVQVDMGVSEFVWDRILICKFLRLWDHKMYKSKTFFQVFGLQPLQVPHLTTSFLYKSAYLNKLRSKLWNRSNKYNIKIYHDLL